MIEKDRINRILKITAGLAILIFLMMLFGGVDFKTWEGLKKVSAVFTYVILFWAFYFSIGWRLPIIKHLIYTENLNGTWLGNYHSKSADNELFNGEIILVIRQTFLWITVVSYTEKYLSYSYGEAILNSVKHDSKLLIYLYSQNQYNPIDNLARRGTSELHLLVENGRKKLFGEFWTNHNSQGGLSLEKLTSKHLSSFADARNFKKP